VLVGIYKVGVGVARPPRLLLDTHIHLRWVSELSRLSRVQLATLRAAVKRGELLALSAMSLIEIALLSSGAKSTLKVPLAEFFQDLNSNPALIVLPLTFDVAQEAASVNPSCDPADRVIVATARVHRLRLITSGQRIIESGLISVVE